MFNIFEFNSEMFRQLIGTAMGAVSYANIFIARRIDSKIMSEAEKYKINHMNPLIFMKQLQETQSSSS